MITLASSKMYPNMKPPNIELCFQPLARDSNPRTEIAYRTSTGIFLPNVSKIVPMNNFGSRPA